MMAIENLSLKHRSDLWFTKQEMDSFKVKRVCLPLIITSTMTMAEYAEINTHDMSTFMGLENYLSPDTPQKMRRTIWNAVLSEQSHQIGAGIQDA